MTWFLFFILSLATARVTWFITEDSMPLIARPRQWIVARNPGGSLAYLAECWYCASIYVAAGASAFAVWALDAHLSLWSTAGLNDFADWKAFLLLWPALSMAAVGIMGAVDWLTGAPEHD